MIKLSIKPTDGVFPPYHLPEGKPPVVENKWEKKVVSFRATCETSSY